MVRLFYLIEKLLKMVIHENIAFSIRSNGILQTKYYVLRIFYYWFYRYIFRQHIPYFINFDKIHFHIRETFTRSCHLIYLYQWLSWYLVALLPKGTLDKKVNVIKHVFWKPIIVVFIFLTAMKIESRYWSLSRIILMLIKKQFHLYWSA